MERQPASSFRLLPALLLAAAAAMTAPGESSGTERPRVSIPPAEIRLIAEGSRLPIDLPTAVRLAAANNLDILEARARYKELKGLRDAALGRFLPRFTGSFRAEKIEGQIQASFGELGRRSFATLVPAARFELSLNPGSALFSALAAHKILRATALRTEHTSQQVLAQVASQHFDLQASLARINIAREALAASRELVRVATAREVEGTGLKVDVKRAEARAADDERRLARAAMEFRKASVALAATLELDPTITLFPLEAAITQMVLTDAGVEIHQLIERAFIHRADLSEQAMRVEAARKRLSAAWADATGPSLYGFFEESEIGISIGNLDNRQIYGGFLGVTLGPESIGLVRVAAARTEIARFGEKRLRHRIAREVISARESVLTSQEEMDAALRQVQAAESSFHLSQARFEGGVGISLELLESQAELSSSRDALVSAIANYNKAQVLLLKALGSISPASLGVNGHANR